MMSYVETSKLPIVVATSSITLQKALLTEYIPQLSKILVDNGIIEKPITAVLRKGKEHYICERNLRTLLVFENDRSIRQTLEKLLEPCADMDLADSDITPYIKRNISVSGRCMELCPYRRNCRFVEMRRQAQSADIDIQVCNHNYLIADTLHRSKGQPPLIPDYQILIIDEAHKFLSAARSMYGTELSETQASVILSGIGNITFISEKHRKAAQTTAKKLSDENAKLFHALNERVKINDGGEKERLTVVIDEDMARYIRNINNIAERLTLILCDEVFRLKAEELLGWVRKKYKVDTNPIKLKTLLQGATYKAGTREEQRKLMHGKMLLLQKGAMRTTQAKEESRFRAISPHS